MAVNAALPPDSLAQALVLERLRLHAALWPRALLLAALVVAVLGVLIWPQVPLQTLRGLLLLWLATMALRAAVGWLHRRTGAVPATAAQRWLWRYRTSMAVHGIVWALAAALLPQRLDAALLDLLVFAITTLTIGVIVTTAFDLVAAAFFAMPALLTLLVQLLAAGNAHRVGMGLMVLLFVLIAVLAALRSRALLRASLLARLGQAAQGEAARRAQGHAEQAEKALERQHRLLDQLLASTDEGFWFIDLEGICTDANPAMCRLLGRPHEQVVGRQVTSFFEGEHLVRLREELDARAGGRERSRYEVALTRPDGTRVWLLNRAQALYDSQGQRIGAVGIWSDFTERRQAEQALRDHERLTNAITEMVAVVGEDRIYRIVNDAWCRSMGVTREQVLGRHAVDLLQGGVDPERERALDACLQLRQPRAVTNLVRPRHAPPRLLESTFTPFHATIDGVRCVAVVSRDVSEREQARAALEAGAEQLRRAESEQRSLLAAFPGLIGCLDERLVYTYVNPGLAALLGQAADQIVGRPASEILGPKRMAELLPLATRALAGETVSLEHRHRLPDGSLGPHSHVTLAPVRDPRTGAPAIVGFAIDISARKRAERALIQARDEAQSANRAKSQFLSQMSHELRTPLNAILGFGQMLHSDPADPPSAHQAAWVQEILHGARHLLELINPMLDLGRIETGQLALQTMAVDLAPLAEECSALMLPLADQRGVHLQVPVGDWGAPAGTAVRADRTRLKQVLLNLLSNAIKYNREGGTVRLACVAPGGVSVELSVIDDGPGLAPEQQARLFQPFERLAAAQSAVEGTGIGLALCRRLVQAMGGEVGVHSAVGQGSRFWLRLPAAPGGADEAAPLQALTAPPHGDPRPAQRQRVLYIEDNPVNLALMQAMLTRLPEVDLQCAERPETGLAMAAEQQPALVLLDIQLPGFDGFEVLRRLRADDRTRSLRVVAVSANALQADIDAALAAGFAAYLTKPLELEVLLATVRRWLGAAAR